MKALSGLPGGKIAVSIWVTARSVLAVIYSSALAALAIKLQQPRRHIVI